MTVTLAPEVLIFDGGIHATWLLVDRLRRGVVPVVAVVIDQIASPVFNAFGNVALFPKLSTFDIYSKPVATYHPYLTPQACLDGVVDEMFAGDYNVPFNEHTLTLPAMTVPGAERQMVLKYSFGSFYHDSIMAYEITTPTEDRFQLPTLKVDSVDYTELEPMYQQLVFWVPEIAALAREVDRARGLSDFFHTPPKPKGKVISRASSRRKSY